MKTLKTITIGTMLFFASNSMNAQVSINVNIGAPPVWAPEVNVSAGFYYLPDIECYYDVRATQFIFLSGGVWMKSGSLPRHCRDYDLNRGYKVVLEDYHGSRPYTNYKYHRVKYYKGYKGGSHGHVEHKDNGHRDYVYYKKDDNHKHDHHDHDDDHNHGNSNKHGGKHGNNGNGNKHKH
ncbi:MAG TPA: hypothetical protein VIV55_07165 [Flavobacterium sp.]